MLTLPQQLDRDDDLEVRYTAVALIENLLHHLRGRHRDVRVLHLHGDLADGPANQRRPVEHRAHQAHHRLWIHRDRLLHVELEVFHGDADRDVHIPVEIAQRQDGL